MHQGEEAGFVFDPAPRASARPLEQAAMGKKQCAASRPGEGGPPAGQPSPAPCPPTVSTAKPGLTFAMPEPVYVTLGRDDVDLQLRHSRFDACLALGLDVEARPSYYRGQQNHRVDTIQICSESACVVVSLAEASVLPPLLGRLVSCPGILKFGCGVVDDLQLLARRFPATFRPKDATRGAFVGSCVELGVLAPLTGAVDAAAQPYGLRRLAAHFGVELHKPKRIQMSDWSRVPLSEAQIRFASHPTLPASAYPHTDTARPARTANIRSAATGLIGMRPPMLQSHVGSPQCCSGLHSALS